MLRPDSETQFGGADTPEELIESYTKEEEEYLKAGNFDAAVDELQKLKMESPVILDLGAGPGTWEVALQKLQPKAIYWHDHSASFEKVARRLIGDCDNVVFNRADITDFSSYKDGMFDLVFSRLALNHASDEAQVLRETFRVLKPGGYFYLSCSNCWRICDVVRPWSWKFLPMLLLPLVYAMTGRKLRNTVFTVEFWIRRNMKKIGFEQLWWDHQSRSTLQALFRRP